MGPPQPENLSPFKEITCLLITGNVNALIERQIPHTAILYVCKNHDVWYAVLRQGNLNLFKYLKSIDAKFPPHATVENLRKFGHDHIINELGLE